MDDLIRRQDAIDAIDHYRGEVKTIPMGTMFKEGVKDGYCRIRSIIMSLPTAQQWIPVSERLPEEEVDVLVTRRFLGVKDQVPPTTYVEVAQYFCGGWAALSDEYKIARNRHTDPIAWMPLPEAWKGSEDKE